MPQRAYHKIASFACRARVKGSAITLVRFLRLQTLVLFGMLSLNLEFAFSNAFKAVV